MKILFYYPVSAIKRFEPLRAIKGSAFFRRPNYDAMRLIYLTKGHDFYYYDERIEAKPDFSFDIAVVNIPLHLAYYVESVIRKHWSADVKILCYGIFPTLFPKEAKKICDCVVKGDIVPLWPQIIDDLEKNNLKEIYENDRLENYFNVNRSLELKYGFTPLVTQLRTKFGCDCLEEFRDYCYESIYYKKKTLWSPSEVSKEVARLNRKVVYIMDDDFLSDLEHAWEILDRCWRYKKMWIFQTKGDYLKNAAVLTKLRDYGTRVIYLKENWLGNKLVERIYDRDFIKEKEYEINFIHNFRIAVGVKIMLGYEGENFHFYRQLTKTLINLKLDFVEILTQTPIPFTPTYKRYERNKQIIKDLSLYDRWMPVVKLSSVNQNDLYSWMETLRDDFYSWFSIIRRMIFVFQNFGIYNTLFFYLLPNLSYRTNFLEKVGYPP